MWAIVVKFHLQAQRGTAVGGCGLEVDGVSGRVGVWQVHHKTWASLVGRDARYVHQCSVCIMGVRLSDDWYLLACSEHACECECLLQGKVRVGWVLCGSVDSCLQAAHKLGRSSMWSGRQWPHRRGHFHPRKHVIHTRTHTLLKV